MAPKAPIHLTASMRVLRAWETPGRMPTISWTKRRVLEAAEETADPDLLKLRAKLERACGCPIAELAEIAARWPDG